MARLLRLAVGTYRAIDAAPPWAWMVAGVAVTVGILEVIS